jgi:hypothetical protein
MRRLLWLLPVAFFFLDPGLACGPPPAPAYTFGAEEMRAAIEGGWSISLAPDDGSPVQQVTVLLRQATGTSSLATAARGPSLVRAAYACGNRTLLRSAGACLDVTTMPLTVTILAGDPVFSAPQPTGTFRVDGLDFFVGELELEVGPYQILMEVASDGSFLDARVGPAGAHATLGIVTRT